ncbi:unnamed protein product [Gongylonema pulchrum]|uniref:RGS domain-containing protein n=1 Tax=Gongylonema pulchrum TaxID=637853 RepID=A0A183ET27_9BILA|nr:unnamed protein product [Gongylonema pulchrum]
MASLICCLRPGYHNLAASLSTVALDQIRAASTDALTKINFFNEFDSLFVRNHPFEDAFDQFIRISLPRTYQEDVFREMYNADCISSCNDMRSIFVRKLTPLLKEALSERIVDFDFCIPHSQESPLYHKLIGSKTKKIGEADLCLELPLVTV